MNRHLGGALTDDEEPGAAGALVRDRVAGRVVALFERVGDPVEVTGSSLDMATDGGDIYDWSIPWSEWTAKSALSKSYAG